mmetsp:Transcript_24297/g.26832  ORF Transcript_24297/g.26832 Transcript_24297/m.26832 type:complete len:227 (+) Transcript_24297:561-1241(+)
MRRSTQQFSIVMLTLPLTLSATEDTDSSCLCSWSSSKNSGSKSKTRFRSKANKFKSSLQSMLPYFVSVVVAVGFNFLISFLIFSISSAFDKSILFKRTLSAKHTCSTASFSTPSAFFSAKRSKMYLASTTVMTLSRRYFALISLSTKNVWTTGAGSANPVVSIRIPSNFSTRLWSFLRVSTKSPRTVQQMHPFITSITSSFTSSLRILSSTPTSPNSFWIMANFIP